MNPESLPQVTESLLDRLVEQICQRIQHGETIELDDLIAQYPEMADRLRDLYPTLLAMANWNQLDSQDALSADDSDEPLLNKSIGDFRIIRQIGRGGMGIVYEAQQLSIQRRVALKVLPLAALVDTRALQRFKNEVSAIATLQHPHIVAVYSVGAERGIHYFAMQLIRGQSLAAVISELRSRADQNLALGGDAIQQAVSDIEHQSEDLEPTAAQTVAQGGSGTVGEGGSGVGRVDQVYFRNVVTLMLQAAEALQHAHDHGIVHRDVKPGNLLLDTEGNLFVTDFGLARIEAEGGLTMTGDVLGTLRYMSPEQLQAKRFVVDHRTDIYSLGATLYELLTLQPMWSGKDKAELIHQISVEDPVRPQKINRAIPGDLETIVLKSINKQPTERYDSAQALSDDLQRFLDHMPILAKRPTAVQSINKWARRHPAIMWSAVVVLVIALLGSTIAGFMIARERTAKEIALLDAQREEARTRQREEVAIHAVRGFGDAVANNPDLRNWPELESLRRTLLQEPLNYFKSLRELLLADADPSIESLSRLAEASQELGRLTAAIGDKQDALNAYQEATSIYERLCTDNPQVTEYQGNLARSLVAIATLLSETGKNADAETVFQQALDIQKQLNLDNPNSARYQADLAGTYNNFAIWLNRTGKPEDAMAAHRQALEIRQGLVRKFPHDNKLQKTLADSQQNVARLLNDLGNLDEAETAYEQALEIRQRLAHDNADIAMYQSDLAHIHDDISALLWLKGKFDDALAGYQQAIEIQEHLVNDNPSITRFRSDLARTNGNLGQLLLEFGKPDQALANYRRSLEIRKRLAKDNPSVLDYQRDLAENCRNIGELLRQMGDPDLAMESYEQALETLQRLAKDNPSVIQYRQDLAASYHNIGIIREQTGKPDEALSAYEQALEIRKCLVRDNPGVTRNQSDLADSYICVAKVLDTAGKLDQALEAQEQALEIQECLVRDNPSVNWLKRNLALSHNNIGNLLLQQGKPEDALAAWQRALEIGKGLALDNPQIADFQSGVGSTLSNMAILDNNANRLQDAFEKLISAVEFQKRALAAKPKHPQYREFLNNHYNNLAYVLSELAESSWFTEATRILREASRSPDGSLDPEYASALNGYLWELVKSPANAETPPITPFHLADIRQAAEQFGQSMFYNTLGTVEFRMGNYQAAIDACTRSIELSQKEQHDAAPGPFDLAIRAMSHLQLDHADEASEYHAQFKAAAEQTQFKDDAECQNFAKEVESMFGELAKPESSANTLDND